MATGDSKDKHMPPLPADFAASIRSQFGEQRGGALLRALDSEPSVSVRLNPRKRSELSDLSDLSEISEKSDGSELAADGRVPWCASGRYLGSRPNFALMPEWHAGAFYVQDASSMSICYILSQLIAEFGLGALQMLDLCAAPGGKTTAALDTLPSGSVCVANEVMPARAGVLRENLLKWGRRDVIVTSAPASKFGKLRDVFDLIIADVPCSGEGMMRKEAEARCQWSEGLVSQCSALQREIVGDAIEALKPGGFLIYSTCTFNAFEDERNVAYLAEKYGLESVEIDVLEGWGISRQTEGDISCLRFLPGEVRGEGLFVCVLRKTEGTPRPKKSPKLPKPAKTAPKGWIDEDLSIYERDGYLYALSDEGARMLARLTDAGIGILSAGVPVAEVKGKDFVPKGALAWFEALSVNAFPNVGLSKEEALAYLRRDAIQLPADAPKGYLTVSYNGVRLGFVKNLGNRANNLYPLEYRLRVN